MATDSGFQCIGNAVDSCSPMKSLAQCGSCDEAVGPCDSVAKAILLKLGYGDTGNLRSQLQFGKLANCRFG